MSSSVRQSRASACAYNLKTAYSLGWLGRIPEKALELYPGLGCAPDSNDMFESVKLFQRENGLISDGKLGRGTWSTILKNFNHIANDSSFWTLNDMRLSVDVDEQVNVINFDQPNGLDLHRFGHFSSRGGRKPHLIVVHWGGLDPHHCHRVFSNPDRKVSSHAGIGLSEDNKPTIYQYLDLHHKSWHSGWANSYSVGIDICQQPSLKWKDHYLSNGYDVEVIENPTNRGNRKVLSIDSRVALATREAVKSLCDVLDIPYEVPRLPNGEFDHSVQDKSFLLNDFTGVIGHHHISPKKWDCACWWGEVFNDL